MEIMQKPVAHPLAATQWVSHSFLGSVANKKLICYWGMATIRAKLGHLTELDMSRLSSYDTTATSLVIAPNVQKWYTVTGTQSSIFVAQ